MAKNKQRPRVASDVRPASSSIPTQNPKAAARAAARQAARRNRIILGGIVGAVVVAIVALIVVNSLSNRGTSGQPARVGAGLVWGPEGAPVRIIDYSDFGCIHCKNFALGAGQKLRAEYEATGKVRFEFKHFIIGGPTTANAANAAECAADQNRFWDYHDLLFSKQSVERDPFNKTALKQYGAQLQLDTATFNRCVDGDQHLDKVYKDRSEGSGQGVNATPTFFVNGTKLEGEVPYNDLKARIDAILAKQ